MLSTEYLFSNYCPFRPPSITPTHSPGSIKNTPTHLTATPTHSSPDHLSLADLNGQLSHLQSLLATERKRKEACQREITRLSRQLAARGEERGTKKTDVDARRGQSLGTPLHSVHCTCLLSSILPLNFHRVNIVLVKRILCDGTICVTEC